MAVFRVRKRTTSTWRTALCLGFFTSLFASDGQEIFDEGTQQQSLSRAAPRPADSRELDSDDDFIAADKNQSDLNHADAKTFTFPILSRQDAWRQNCTNEHLVLRQGKLSVAPKIVEFSRNKLAAAQVATKPYEHVYITEYFEPSFYRCLVQHLPPGGGRSGMAALGGGNGHRFTIKINLPNKPGPSTKKAAAIGVNRFFWRAFAEAFGSLEFTETWIMKFARTLKPRLRQAAVKYPDNPNQQDEDSNAAGMEPANFSTHLDLSRDLAGYAIDPHTDTDNKLVTTLYYLPSGSQMPKAGTLVLKSKRGAVSKDGTGKRTWASGRFVVAKQLRYLPNVVVAFAPCWRSWHAVRKISSPSIPRDTIQGFIHSSKQAIKRQCPN
ncbi:hypothetical protein CYMTET_24873 [Cymbomonas tetramitiformis]|uniref:Fe2OG dioxygenase domain-containing protein n=1 Tax=Cymbomonas tetramitiformis TaxID=36881 RepID=A0AAE0FWG3_9CHLO|nr:hypothetical protein CYMTET_24873 [Cymbomonas tetramitiformis]